MATPPGSRRVIPSGTQVRVRTRFEGSWADGFEVAGYEIDQRQRPQYRVRRVSDQTELPSPFGEDQVVPTDLSGMAGQFWPGMP